MHIFEFFKAALIGIVEGITEWLPVSSTGHMILFDEFIKLDVSEEFMEMFLVVIQLGAILAVPILFWDKLVPFGKGKTKEMRKSTVSLWLKVIVGALPAAVIGLLFDDIIESVLYNYVVVAIALIVYGVAFIIIEKIRKDKPLRVETVDQLSYIDALKIGGFQVLALIPGTSRSGSTILGGVMSGVSRTASAEFSFFMAIPIMLGASGLKILKFLIEGFSATAEEMIVLFIGIVVSFAVSLFTIKFLMDFVKRHNLVSFGIYRIILGAVVLIYFLVKSLV